MHLPRLLTPVAASIVLAASLAGCSGSADSDASPAPVVTSSPAAATSPSDSPASADASAEPSVPEGRVVSYDDYEADPAAYADSDVVLYFHAPWCHECQATDAALESDGIPAGLTLVQIDYDSRTDLRQKYGVTIQHSFVLLDADGAKQEIWTDTTSGAEIAQRAA